MSVFSNQKIAGFRLKIPVDLLFLKKGRGELYLGIVNIKNFVIENLKTKTVYEVRSQVIAWKLCENIDICKIIKIQLKAQVRSLKKWI